MIASLLERVRALLVPRWSWHLPSWETEFLSGLACVVLAIATLVATAVLLYAMAGHWQPPAPLPVFLLAAAFGVFYEAAIDAKGWDLADVALRMIGVSAGALAYAALLRILVAVGAT